MFTSDDFIEEAYKLAKPGAYLSLEGAGEIAAIWGGEGIVPAPANYTFHWLTIDCRFLPHDEFSMTGCLSVYSDKSGLSGMAAHDPERTLSASQNGITLYATEAQMLPPADYVCMAGSEKVKDWLRSIDWQPEHGSPRSPEGKKLISAYEGLYWAQPLFKQDSDIYAFMGGFNFVYLEFSRLLQGESLVLCTLQDSEPWMEVWRDSAGNLSVESQIT